MKVTLFIPCLVDRFLPEIGTAAVRLLEMAGVHALLDRRQTCCGQPAFNAGHPDLAASFARRLLRILSVPGVVVAPSGSCVAMVREFYGDMDLAAADLKRWRGLKDRVFELSEFLHREGLISRIRAKLQARAVVHHSCHHLRHTGGAEPLNQLLGRVFGLKLLEHEEASRCCGFGGVFSTRLPELSVAIARDRLDAAIQTRPDYIALADAGCIVQLRGVAAGSGATPGNGFPRIVHYAQLITGVGLTGGRDAS